MAEKITKRLKPWLVGLGLSACLVGVTGTQAEAQIGANYTFSQSSGTYTPITGGTLVTNAVLTTSLDSWTSPAQTIPAIIIDGVSYTTAYMTSNGLVKLGGTAPGTTLYTGMSTAPVGGGIHIAPFNADLNKATTTATSELRWEQVGNELVFQWQDWCRYNQTESFDMQARINMISGNIVFVYKLNSGPGTGTTYQPQVGIATGNSGLNYLNRLVGTTAGQNWDNSVVGTSNTSTCRFTGSTTDPRSFTTGQTYTFTYTPPSCFPPSSLASNSVTSATAVISWTAPATAPANGYEYYYSTTNTAPTASTTPSGSTGAGVTTANLTTLTPATQYYVWVRSNCGATDKSIWSASATFTTLCVPFSAPFTQNFNAGSLPNCWTNTNPTNTASGYWLFSGAPGYDATANGRTVGTYAWVDASSPYPLNGVALTSPQINLTGLTIPYIQFDFFKNHTYPAYTNAVLKVEVNSGSGWNQVYIDSTNASIWRTIGVPIAAYANQTVSIRFVVDKSNYFYDDLLLDEFMVVEAPTCFTPLTLTHSNIASTGATISWVAPAPAPANGYEYYYSTSNTAPTAATTPSGAVAAGVTTANLTTLTANTTYYYWVRSVCSTSDKSAWSASGTFFTGYCSPAPSSVDGSGITNVSFSNVNNPTGTETNNYGNYSAMVGDVYQGQVVPVDITFSTGYTYDTKIWIDWNNDLDFDDPGEEVYVGVSLSTNPTTLNASFTVPPATALGQYRMRIGGQDAGPPVPCYTGSWGSYEDYTINVTVPPTCIPPTALNVTAINSNGATLNWTASTTTVGVGYDYYISTSNTAPIATTTPTGSVGATATSATNSTLTPATNYYYWVRSNCAAADQSAWTYGGTFTTLCATFTAPFLEEFSTGSLPNCWTNSNNPAATDAYLFWRFSGTPDYGTTNNGKTAGTFAWVDASTPYTSDVMLTTPLIDLSAVSSPFVQFQWYKHHSTSATGGITTAYDNNNLIVEIKDAAATTWTQIFSDTSNAPNWRNENITLPASYAGATIQLRFTVDKNIGSNPYFYDNVLLDSVYVSGAICTPPVVALGNDTAICEGSSLTLDAGTQATGATIAWNPGGATTQTITVNSAGTYSVTVTDGACSTSDTIVVAVQVLPVVDLGNDTLVCDDVPYILNAGGTSTDTYVWSNGSSTSDTMHVNASGQYYVTVTNAIGCSSSDTVNVTIGNTPTIDGITSTNNGGTFTFEGNNVQNANTYSWNFGDNSPLDNTSNPSHPYTQTNDAQTFTVTLIVSNDCGSDTATTTITVPPGVGVNNLKLDANTLKLYPNPTSNTVTLENTSNFKMKQVVVTNVLGQQVLSVDVKDNKIQTLNVSQFTTGIYHVRIEFEEGVVTRKLEVLK